MSKTDTLTLDQERLRAAWSNTLPTLVKDSEMVEVRSGLSNQELRIHIVSTGRSKYSLDFSVTYVDSREVKVELVDVERDDQSIDEHTDMVQDIVQKYVRHLHECAQALQKITHA